MRYTTFPSTVKVIAPPLRATSKVKAFPSATIAAPGLTNPLSPEAPNSGPSTNGLPVLPSKPR